MKQQFRDTDLNDQFVREGAVVIDLFDATEVETLWKIYNEHTRQQEAGFDSTILDKDISARIKVNSAIRDLISAPLSQVLIDYHPVLCTFVAKLANRTDSEVPMHQDWAFVDEPKFLSIGLWCPLLDVNLQNGCLQIVKGSHTFASIPRAANTDFLFPDLVPALRENYLTDVPMRAGQAMLFDNRLFHCSPPNKTDSKRVAATAVLIPVDSRLRYYHVLDQRNPKRLEVFEVPDDFYIHHAPGNRPEKVRSLGIIEI